MPANPLGPAHRIPDIPAGAAQASLYEYACGPLDEGWQPDPRVDYEAIEPAPADGYPDSWVVIFPAT